MLKPRIIPCLDVKDGRVVKGINFVDLRDAGDPVEQARIYDAQGADEVCFLDITASSEDRDTLLDVVARTAEVCFMPLTAGGGVRSPEDVRKLLLAGADKVAINTAVVLRPELIREAARAFGSSTIVVSIEAIKRADGSYEAYVDYGRQSTGVSAFDWALRAVELGAGELMVTSIDNEGTGKGFDLELTRRISESVPVPVIAAGGVGNAGHVYEGIVRGKADAVSLASTLHYNCLKNAGPSDDDYSGEGNTEFLNGGGGTAALSSIADTTIHDIKAYLAQNGVKCRS